MKKITVLLLCLLLTGCAKSPQESSALPPEPPQTTDSPQPPADAAFAHVELAALEIKPADYTQHDNQITLYTDDAVRAAVQAQTDYAVSSAFFSHVPESVSRVSQFTRYYPAMSPAYDAYVQFASLWKALFPDAPMNERNLFWHGKNSGWEQDETGEDRIDGFKNVQESLGMMCAQAPGDVWYMFYSPHFQASQPDDTDEPNRFLELQNAPGIGLANFNKGVLSAFISGQNGQRDTRFLETFVSAESYLPRDLNTGRILGSYTQKRYRPTDTETVTLTDGKEIRICDAVRFFEDYLNTLPAAAAPGCDIAVTEVTASTVGNNGECALDFLATDRFEGILFDYNPGVSIHDNGDSAYAPVMCMGTMAVTDDVNSAYGFGRTMPYENRQDFTEIAPLETALHSCCDTMSQYADWEMLSAELVYCEKRGKKAEGDRQDYLYSVAPCYKFVLYNRTDALEYAVYIDAVTGEFTRYYKASGYRRE